MPQHGNHERLAPALKNLGWVLWDHGIDSSCEVGGDAPHAALIWLKPCLWDTSQMIPVGCLCCTDLDKELFAFLEEKLQVIGRSAPCDWTTSCQPSRTVTLEGEHPELAPIREKPLSPPPTWLRPYRAR